MIALRLAPIGILACAALPAADIQMAAAAREPLAIQAGDVTYQIDPATLKIDAVVEGQAIPIMPALHSPRQTVASRIGSGWTIAEPSGDMTTISLHARALRVSISRRGESQLSWGLPKVEGGTWSISDGEGIAFDDQDPFWRTAYRNEECLGATSALSLPAWSHLSRNHAITYAFGDGLQSELCLRDGDGVQARLGHRFSTGAQTLELYFRVDPPDLLAPAKFYRQLLQQRDQFKSFASKSVPKLHRLFGAPHAYVWGDGRNLAFLHDLHALGIERMLLSYDQNPQTQKQIVGPAYLARADALGYLTGPYEAFENGQPQEIADAPTAIWSDDLFPSGCIRGASGKVTSGFAGRGCEMSSQALTTPSGRESIASRYGKHVADGAAHVFLDVDAFGDFKADFSSDHPMTMAQDRSNRLERMALALNEFRLVLGSEHVKAWSSGVTHYSHGTAQSHFAAVWPLTRDKERFGRWWPTDRPGFFFKPIELTAREARLTFGAADRVPLFEAAFHDSVVSTDRWEWSLMKVAGQERSRFARALLYGTPTMWSLDRAELQRIRPWLKAASEAFKLAHGQGPPVALTGFRWLSADRLIQEARYEDGRTLVANFSAKSWKGLASNCVRVIRQARRRVDLCPPPLPS